MNIFSGPRCVIILSLLAAAVCFPGVAQENLNLRIQELSRLRVPGGTIPAAGAVREPAALDEPVIADEYLVGPGDGLAVHIWSTDPREYQVTVTPEGYLVIPGIGRTRVTDSTLSSVTRQLVGLLARYYPTSPVSVTLVTPRTVVVEVTGLVLNPGRYRVSPIERAGRVLELANTPQEGQELQPGIRGEIDYLRANAAERGVILRRRNGHLIRVDFLRHALQGGGSHNPYLAEGDVLHVPKRSPLMKSIGAFGAVVREGTFEYVDGDRLSFVLAACLGLTPTADSANAVLTRLSPDGMAMESVRIDLRMSLTGGASDVPVRPGDRLLVPEIVDARQNYLVAVEGAVLRPGRYPVTRGSTRLADVILAAGGFTRGAFLGGASITRSTLGLGESPDQIEIEYLRSRRGAVSVQDTAYYAAESALRLRGELVVVDFEKLFSSGDSTQNILLRPHDIIRIPERQHTVFVFGQVRSPGHIPLLAEGSVSEYIARAGGYTEDARTGDVAVIKNGSRLWLSPDDTEVEDGDLVWVPREEHYPLSHYISIYAQVAAVVGVAATVALLIDNLSR